MNLETFKDKFTTLADQWKTTRKAQAHLLADTLTVAADQANTKLENMKKEIAFAVTLLAAQPAANSEDTLTIKKTYKGILTCQTEDAATYELLRQDATSAANIVKLRDWLKALLGGKGDADKDIPEGEFVGTIRAWITQTIAELAYIKKNYTDGAFDFVAAANNLPFLNSTDGGSNYPIVGKIAIEIQTAAKSAKTLHECADVCSAALLKFDNKYLEAEYASGKKKYYGDKALTISSVITNNLPSNDKSQLRDALVAGCANCGQLPKPQNRIAHDKDVFCNYYKSLLDNTAVAIKAIAYDSSFIVHGNVLKDQLKNTIEMDLGKEFIIIVDSIPQDDLSFSDACEKVANKMESLYKDTNFLTTLYEAHKFVPYPATHTRLQEHIVNTIRQQGGVLDNSLKIYQSGLLSWSETVKHVVYDCPVNSFSIAKLKELIPSAFTGLYIDYSVVEFLGKEFQASLAKHKEDTIKKEDLRIVWEEFLRAGIDTAKTSAQFQGCKTHFDKSLNLAVRAAQNISLYLPIDKRLMDLLKLCAYREPRALMPASIKQGDMDAVWELVIRNKKDHTIRTTCHLYLNLEYYNSSIMWNNTACPYLYVKNADIRLHNCNIPFVASPTPTVRLISVVSPTGDITTAKLNQILEVSIAVHVPEIKIVKDETSKLTLIIGEASQTASSIAGLTMLASLFSGPAAALVSSIGAGVSTVAEFGKMVAELGINKSITITEPHQTTYQATITVSSEYNGDSGKVLLNIDGKANIGGIGGRVNPLDKSNEAYIEYLQGAATYNTLKQ